VASDVLDKLPRLLSPGIDTSATMMATSSPTLSSPSDATNAATAHCEKPLAAIVRAIAMVSGQVRRA